MANKGKKIRPATGAPETETLLTTGTTLDLKGLKCPLPVLKARKRLKSMPSGAVLHLLADDPAAVIDVPHFCTEQGHGYLGQSDALGHQVYLIRKGG